MEVSAKAKYIRMSPRKIRLVADIIRGMKIENALIQLDFVQKKATIPLKKVLLSAIANAENNFDLKKENLIIKEINVDEGPMLKRWMPRARGSATTILKRTSHIKLLLGEIVDSGKKEGKKQKVEDPIKLGKNSEKDIKLKSSKKIDINEDNEKRIASSQGGDKNRLKSKSNKGFMNKFFNRRAGSK